MNALMIDIHSHILPGIDDGARSLDESLSFQRKFSRFVDVPSSSDIFSIEDEIASEIGELLSLDIFNTSLGNW